MIFALLTHSVILSCGSAIEPLPATKSPELADAMLAPITDVDLIFLRRIIEGGTTPEATVSSEYIYGLKQIETRRLRLINVDRNLISIDQDGKLQIVWSKHLIDGLRLCKENKWIPHLIIGHLLPEPLAITGEDGRKYGPSSWFLYEKYIEAFLYYVTIEWGFIESEWEVGNEMNIPKFNWVAQQEPTGPFDMNGFTAYMNLYSRISHVFHEFKQRNPQVVVRLGGPAIAPLGFLEKTQEHNWVFRFVDEIAEKGLVCDFISMHFYGNEASGKEMAESINTIQSRMKNKGVNVSISISEWGLDWRKDSDANFSSIAGAFTLEFLKTLAKLGIDDGIFLALSEFPGLKWPVLYSYNGTSTYYMKSMTTLHNLNGKVLNCKSDLTDVDCIAVMHEKNVDIVFWRLGWWNNKFKEIITDSINNVNFNVSGIGLEERYQVLKFEMYSTDTINMDLNSVYLDVKDLSLNVIVKDIPWGGYGNISLELEN